MGIYSQADGGNESVSCSVSPETGQVNFRIPIISLSGSASVGDQAKRDIALVYNDSSATVGEPTSYGTGWSLQGVSRIDYFTDGACISLSNGKRFSQGTPDGDGRVHYKDQKTQDVAVFWDATTKRYTVYHKDGVVEKLYDFYDNNHFTLEFLIFSNGERFQFSYNRYFDKPFLSNIARVEDSTDLVNFTYEDSFLTSISLWRGTAYAESTFYVSDYPTYSSLTYFTAFAGATETSPPTSFVYEEFGLASNTPYRLLQEITYPGGASETFTRDGGHEYYPDPSVTDRAPRVKSHVYKPAGSLQAAITNTYSYSDHNFLGNPNSKWTDSADNMYDYEGPDKYKYSVTVTTSSSVASAKDKVVKKEFNAFHLLKSETQTCQGCTMSKTYTYPCDDPAYSTTSFYDQPKNVLFATSVDWTVTDRLKATKTRTSSQTVDEYGNITSMTQSSGLVKTTVYYGKDGEQDSCPADPFNLFPRFVKTETTSSSDEKLKKAITMTYGSFSPLSSAPSEISAVVKVTGIHLEDLSTETVSGVDDCMVTITRDTGSNASYYTHNAISSVTLQNSSDSPTAPPTITCTFTRTVGSNEDILTITKLSGQDGASFSREETVIATTGLVTRKKDRDGIVTTGTYALSGKLLTSTTGVGTDYERKTTYEYNPDDALSNGLYTVVRTDTNGVKTRLSYDHDGNILSAEESPVPLSANVGTRSLSNPLILFNPLRILSYIGGEFFRFLSLAIRPFRGSRNSDNGDRSYTLVYSQDFDEFGRQSSETVTDSTIDPTTGDVQAISNTVTDTEYDGWGQVCKRTKNGIVERITNDPINLERTVRTHSVDNDRNVTEFLAPTTTTLNIFRGIESISQTKDDGSTITTSFSYDGLGRRKIMTSPMGSTIAIQSFDLFDRPVQITRADGVVADITYCATSPSSLVESLSLKEPGNPEVSHTIGSRTFDGINRPISKTVGGLTTSFAYKDGSSIASTITTPANNFIGIDFNSGLVSMPDNVWFWYDDLGTEQNADDFIKYTYGTDTDTHTMGRLIKAESPKETKDWTYRNTGAVSSCTSSRATGGISYQDIVSGGTSLCGRPTDTKITLSKDGSNSLQENNTTQEYNSDGYLVATEQGDVRVEVSYDAFGRFAAESIKQSGAEVQNTDITWDSCGREVSRTVAVTANGTVQTLKVGYVYDDEQKVTKTTVSLDGAVQVVTNLAYDSMSRLTSYQVEDGYVFAFLAKPGKGVDLGITGQTIVYDIFNNIQSMQSTLVGSDGTEYTDNATWTYSDAKTARPTSISHTLTSHFPGTLNFSYDADGNLSSVSWNRGSDKEISMTYSIAGRLLTFKDENGIEETFSYDTFQRTLMDSSSFKCYDGNQLACEQGLGEASSLLYLRLGDRVVNEKTLPSANRSIASDHNMNQICSSDGTSTTFQSYSPFGSSGDTAARTGFAGMIRNKNNGGYQPGNGTRLYLPQFGRFSSIDTMSPFGGGGINPYVYCSGDPMNRRDPTGHWSTQADLALNVTCLLIDFLVLAVTTATMGPIGTATGFELLGIVGGVFGVVSDTLGMAADSVAIEDSNKGWDRSATSQRLGVSSSAFGLLSLGADSVSSFGEGVPKMMTEMEDRHMRKGVLNSVALNDPKKGVTGVCFKRTGEFATDGAPMRNMGEGRTKSVLDIPDKSIVRQAPAETVLTSFCGIDFQTYDKIKPKGTASWKKGLLGTYLLAQVADQGMGYALLIKGTWRGPGQDTESLMSQVEQEVGQNTMSTYYDGMQSAVQDVIFDKLPTTI